MSNDEHNSNCGNNQSGNEFRVYELDARGLLCPEPVMLLHKKIREMKVGDRLKVLATDPSTQRDFSRFCEFLPHELLEEKQQGEEFVYLIEKGEKPR